MFAIGIDLGGTKTSVIVLGEDDTPVWSRRVATPQEGYDAILETVVALVEEARTHCLDKVPDSIGIGIPGELSSDLKTVKNANSTVLIGKPLGADLSQRLGCDVRIANDATCFAASEALDGAGKDGEIVFGVIIGTGVGGGIAIRGIPHTGINRLAGEWGHNPFPLLGAEPKQRPCYCGQTDCIETWLSGPALTQDYADLKGHKVPAIELVARAKKGNPIAEEVIDTYVTNLAKGLSTIVNTLDPDVIVLGGGVSNIEHIYSVLPERIASYVFNATDRPVELKTRIVRNKWGDDSGVRGAAWLTRT